MTRQLRLLRVQSGMTLERLAEASGLTRSYLSKVERGLSNPSIASALTIAKALGVTVERLFGQDSRHEAIDIVRASDGVAGDRTTTSRSWPGLSPGRDLRASSCGRAGGAPAVPPS